MALKRPVEPPVGVRENRFGPAVTRTVVSGRGAGARMRIPRTGMAAGGLRWEWAEQDDAIQRREAERVELPQFDTHDPDDDSPAPDARGNP
jgi:hypothetical protein